MARRWDWWVAIARGIGAFLNRECNKTGWRGGRTMDGSGRGSYGFSVIRRPATRRIGTGARTVTQQTFVFHHRGLADILPPEWSGLSQRPLAARSAPT